MTLRCRPAVADHFLLVRRDCRRRRLAAARWVVGWVVVWVVALALTSTLHAQPRFGQPIYPGYQGYVENPDGSLTVVFQYFSHGRDPVTIPVGPQNQFTGVADRNQPITFLPGNHEFVCVMVVENREALQALQWTVAFPEKPVGTSIDPLNLEYMLMARNQERANHAIDPPTAPRGVCLNKPPTVLAKPRSFSSENGENEELQATVGQDLTLKGSARDEGLPRGSAVTTTWAKISGPGEVTFADSGSPETSVTFGAAGTYELELSATDGERESSARVMVVVSEA